jgi:1-deoxy-D-xylulose-5-phosphate reductoisomerase
MSRYANPPKRVAIFGSTGSIGQNALEVIEHLSDRLRAVALTAHRHWDLLVHQAWRFRPRWVTLTDPVALALADESRLPPETQLLRHEERIADLACHAEVDLVLVAVVGAAGLQCTWAAVRAGKQVALANKESLVLAGSFIVEEARRTGARLLPVDSEHSAVFQLLQQTAVRQVRRVILTASGGPFRTWSTQQLAAVRPEEALQHPTWKMGPKITVDSATMMNKALEIIEARWLFQLDPSQIAVVIHPQSIVHSLIELVDGTVLAQMSPPDMKLPIQYALCYPDRCPGPARRIDWTQPFRLEFEVADPKKFPALELGFDAARRGGTAGAVLNAANEVAVERFLRGEIGFLDIIRLNTDLLSRHQVAQVENLDQLLAVDQWAREEARRWVPQHAATTNSA